MLRGSFHQRSDKNITSKKLTAAQVLAASFPTISGPHSFAHIDEKQILAVDNHQDGTGSGTITVAALVHKDGRCEAGAIPSNKPDPAALRLFACHQSEEGMVASLTIPDPAFRTVQVYTDQPVRNMVPVTAVCTPNAADGQVFLEGGTDGACRVLSIAKGDESQCESFRITSPDLEQQIQAIVQGTKTGPSKCLVRAMEN